MSTRRTLRTLALLTLTLTACRPATIGVRPVEYRLKGYVGGPLNHGFVRDGRDEFTDVFCATLDHVKASGESWNACADYLEPSHPASPTTPAAIAAGTKVLLVAGIFSECLAPEGVTIFKDAARHLMNPAFHNGITVEHVPVPALGSSAANADAIRAFIQAHPGPYIAVGYSKGAGDLMEAIDRHADVRSQIRALVTIAGSVGGSRLPDQFSGGLLAMIKTISSSLGLPGCNASDGGGVTSLTRPDRQAFLQHYNISAVPAFSVVAVADDQRISRVLKPTWTLLQAFSQDEDSQVIADDAVVPGGTFLGVARADHWAVALPFAEMTDPAKRRRALELVDKNTYPRTALLEAVLHFIATH
jgi:hypothetical protein